MTAFEYRNGELHAEGVAMSSIAEQYDTPCFVYSRAAIEQAYDAWDSALDGVPHLVCFAVKANSNLGVLNLLPIPVLDGGQIVYQVAEWVKGSPLSDKAQILGQQVGILALLLLMSFAFYNDIARIIG